MFKKFALLLLLACVPTLRAQTAALPVYDCVQHATQADVSGLQSTNYQQGIIPSCTVTVYLTGTTTIATTTPQSPFTANTNGSIPPIYAAINQGYDVVLSGGISPNTYPTPITLTGLYPGFSFNGAGNPCGSFPFTVNCGGTGSTSAAGANLNITGITQTGTLGTSSQVSTLPGSLISALLDSGGQVYDVKAYGATGNGSTDDTAALLALYAKFSVNLVGTGLSGTIFYPCGTYKITQPLVLAGLGGANVNVAGIKGCSAISYQGPSTPTELIYWGDTAGPIIEGLNILTNGNTTYAAVHLAATNAHLTTLGTAVTVPGSATVTPASMGGINLNTLLPIDAGTANAELVYVTALVPSLCTPFSTCTGFTATFTKTHLSTAAVGGGPTMQAAIIRDNLIAVNGSGAGVGNGIVIGTGQSSQTSEIKIYDNDIAGVGSSGSGILSVDTNNVGDIWTERNRFSSWAVPVNFALTNFANSVRDTNFEGSTVADIKFGGGGELDVDNIYSEPAAGAAAIIQGFPTYSRISISNYIFAAASGPATYALQNLQGQVTLKGNTFIGTVGTPIKLSFASPIVAILGASITSENNYYGYASGWAPFYDGSNNAILPTYYNNQPVAVTSSGDTGGASYTAPLTPLKNYQQSTAITDQGCAAVAGSGLIRGCSTDPLVEARNFANHADVSVLSIDSSDVVHVGGAALVGSGPAIPTGPASTTSGDAVVYTGTSGQQADAGFAPAPAIGCTTVSSLSPANNGCYQLSTSSSVAMPAASAFTIFVVQTEGSATATFTGVTLSSDAGCSSYLSGSTLALTGNHKISVQSDGANVWASCI